MKHRIITHAGCLDGFCSAFVFKKYIAPTLKIPEDIEIVPVMPKEIELEEVEIQKGDIILDLPRPKKEVFFWCDHHITNKPEEEKKNHHWKLAPSCTGVLIELAVSRGVKENEELKNFKQCMDIIDGAMYDKKQYKECYYPAKDKLTALQQFHALSSSFQTKDPNLNDEIYRRLLSNNLERSPITSSWFKSEFIRFFYDARLRSYQEWRDQVDTYVYYDEKSKCVVQDDRKIRFRKGLVDRFYVHYKFPETSYSISLRPELESDQVRMSIGCNIFHKERCKIHIGNLCREVGKKFGEGSGGGHLQVGGCTVLAGKADDAMRFILEKMKD